MNKKVETLPVVDSYMWDEAVADGILVDMTKKAADYGFSIPVAMTQGVDYWLTPEHDAESLGETRDGRYKVMFAAIKKAISGARNRLTTAAKKKGDDNIYLQEVEFAVPFFVRKTGGGVDDVRININMRAVLQAMSNKKPAMTILLNKSENNGCVLTRRDD